MYRQPELPSVSSSGMSGNDEPGAYRIYTVKQKKGSNSLLSVSFNAWQKLMNILHTLRKA